MRRSYGNLEMSFARVNALDDLFDGLVFDEQVAYFDGGENLADQIRGGNSNAIKPDAMRDVVQLLDFTSIARECDKPRRLRAVFQREFYVLGAQQLFLE